MERGSFRFRRQYGSTLGCREWARGGELGSKQKHCAVDCRTTRWTTRHLHRCRWRSGPQTLGFRNIAMPRNVCGPHSCGNLGRVDARRRPRRVRVLRQHAARLEPQNRQMSSQRWRDTPNIYIPSRLSPAASLRFPAQVTIPSKSGTWTHYVCVGTLEGHQSDVHSVAVSPDGTLIASTGFTDLTIRLWDFKSGVCLQAINQGPRARSPVSVTFSSLGSRLVVGNADNTISVYHLNKHINHVACCSTPPLRQRQGRADRRKHRRQNHVGAPADRGPLR